MNALAAHLSTTALLALVPAQVDEIYAWAHDLAPVVALKTGIGAALAAVAAERGVPVKTVRKKFDLFRKQGITGLINRKHAPALWAAGHEAGLSEADQELVKLWCEKFQRNSQAALRALRRTWRTGKLSGDLAGRGLTVPQTAAPLDPLTGYPRGWSERNLARYAPTEYEIKAARIGRSAAASHRPLVYTTRSNLYVGQFYLFDDIWHDHEVVDLDQRKRGRPLEFHALDLSSACKFAWGNRTRVQRIDGTHEGLKGGDFRFLLASVLGCTGYSPRGTALIVEHGTAAIGEEIERLLFDATGGLVTVQRGGMQGAAAHAGQYAGRAKGNFRFKASLESLGNLIHNELAALPGQTGLSRQRAPEEQHGRQRHTDALLCALAQLPPERVEWLSWDFCTIQQFRQVAEEVYARINRRQEHDLEGWDARYVPDRATGRMRRKSPWEVWTPGRRELQPICEATLALVLGTEQGRERTTRNGMIELQDAEISGDLLRFDATALPDREKYLTVLNPFDAGRLFVFDARGGFVGSLPRLHSVCRGDVEAVQRAMGAAAKTEAELLAPLRRRHLGEAREKLARHQQNSEAMRERTAPSRLPADADEFSTPAPTVEDDTDDLAQQLNDLL